MQDIPSGVRRSGAQLADSEAGGALLFVMIISTAALFVAVMSVSIGLSGRRNAVNNLHLKTAFFCAESALELARGVVGANGGDVNAILAGGAAGWYPVIGVCPSAPAYTYQVTIRDNADDEDQTSDSDNLLIFDADALFAGSPVATVSAAVEVQVSPGVSHYTHQQGYGALQLGNR